MKELQSLSRVISLLFTCVFRLITEATGEQATYETIDVNYGKPDTSATSTVTTTTDTTSQQTSAFQTTDDKDMVGNDKTNDLGGKNMEKMEANFALIGGILGGVIVFVVIVSICVIFIYRRVGAPTYETVTRPGVTRSADEHVYSVPNQSYEEEVTNGSAINTQYYENA